MTFKGKLTWIGETKVTEDWAVANFELTREVNGYNESGLFEMFKKGQYIDIAKDFERTFKLGDIVEVEFSLSTREYNGKKYGSNRVFKINRQDVAQQAKASVVMDTDRAELPDGVEYPEEDINPEDIPF